MISALRGVRRLSRLNRRAAVVQTGQSGTRQRDHELTARSNAFADVLTPVSEENMRGFRVAHTGAFAGTLMSCNIAPLQAARY
jgi:hypothetical protein